MTRLPPGKGCPTGKAKYESRAEARQAARNVQQWLGPMHAYRCWSCRWYHIGHEKGWTE